MREETPFADKIIAELAKSVIVISSLNEYPNLQLINKNVHFKQAPRSIIEIQESRFNFFELRLALVEERVFSHTGIYDRPRLNDHKQGQKSQLTTVYNLHSILGKKTRLTVLGILTQKEDTHYYLEDKTCTMKLSFVELEYADPDAYFTENCVLLCEGYHSNDVFMVTSMSHPPLHANKQLRFKLTEEDYFGAYTKLNNQNSTVRLVH